MIEINMKELIKIALGKWWIFIISILIFGGASYVWTNYFTTPVYASYTTLYVGKNIDSEGIESSDLNLGANLILDYRELSKSKLVAREVLDDVGLQNISADSLAERIEVTQKNESRVIQISVSDTDPQVAMELTNKVAEIFQKNIIKIMQVENIQVIDKAEIEENPISPNKKMNYIIGIILGFIVAIAVILLTKYLDNTIKTAEDVKEHLDLPVIGDIPLFHLTGGKVKL